MEVPSDLVMVGHVLDAWRLDGSVKVAPYASDAAAMLSAKQWWLDVSGAVRSFDFDEEPPTPLHFGSEETRLEDEIRSSLRTTTKNPSSFRL